MNTAKIFSESKRLFIKVKDGTEEKTVPVRFSKAIISVCFNGLHTANIFRMTRPRKNKKTGELMHPPITDLRDNKKILPQHCIIELQRLLGENEGKETYAKAAATL